MFKKNKKAYTLIEMMVVMGIMAVFALLTASAMVGSNNDNIADETAQGIISAVREAQTKAISITPDATNQTPKVWAVEVNTNPAASRTYGLYGYYIPSNPPYPTACAASALSLDTATLVTSSAFKARAGVSLTITRLNPIVGATNPTTAYIAYTTPFAATYMTFDDDCVPASSNCKWKPACNPEQDWGAAAVGSPNSVMNNSNSTQGININIQYKNASRDVVIYSNGDAYVK